MTDASKKAAHFIRATWTSGVSGYFYFATEAAAESVMNSFADAKTRGTRAVEFNHLNNNDGSVSRTVLDVQPVVMATVSGFGP